jgi:hypothetical protein
VVNFGVKVGALYQIVTAQVVSTNKDAFIKYAAKSWTKILINVNYDAAVA